MQKSTSYTSVPLDEHNHETARIRNRRSWGLCTITPTAICIFFCLLSMVLISFTAGLKIGQTWGEKYGGDVDGLGEGRADGLRDPREIIGEIPKKEVMFQFPSGYEDTSEEGDRIWDEMMPLGAGFLRVPHPRLYALPRSKKIENDTEDAEIYSVSMTHGLHCLAVLRHIIIKYEKKDKSRFAGAGHEYHCLDYIRQSLLCAGDTTLDHAQIEYNPDGSERKYGFDGANATHTCRDWDAIQRVLVEKRVDDKRGILF